MHTSAEVYSSTVRLKRNLRQYFCETQEANCWTVMCVECSCMLVHFRLVDYMYVLTWLCKLTLCTHTHVCPIYLMKHCHA